MRSHKVFPLPAGAQLCLSLYPHHVHASVVKDSVVICGVGSADLQDVHIVGKIDGLFVGATLFLMKHADAQHAMDWLRENGAGKVTQ